MDVRWKLGATHHHSTDEGVTDLDNGPGFLSGRGEGQAGEGEPWEDTGHGE